MNDISQEISTTLFENSVQYNLRVESKQIVSKRKSAKSKMGKWGVQLLAYLQIYKFTIKVMATS